MLKALTLRQIAIVETVTVTLDSGMTVITGETGSGKSLLIDAISLAFGEKVSPKEVIKADYERGSVELLFDVCSLKHQASVRSFLAEQGVELLPEESEILISREFTRQGSRCRINGYPVPRDVLLQLRPWVLDLHGQHELTSLFQKERQRGYLDQLGDAAFQALKKQVGKAYFQWWEIRRKLEDLEKNQQERLQRLDFLSYQHQELAEAQLTDPEEDIRCQQELAVLSHAENLIQASAQAAFMLGEGADGAPAVVDLLSKTQRTLADVAAHDPQLHGLSERLHGVAEEVKSLASDLSRYHQCLEVDPERMQVLVDRLDLLEKLKRKYGPTLADVMALQDQVAQELEELSTDGESVVSLQAACTAYEATLNDCSTQLTQQRQQLATYLQNALACQLQDLALPTVTFEIAITPTSYSPEGMDEVEFLFSANPGEPVKPLAKVASGGELSRCLLGLKVLSAQGDGVQTLVFDEIDTGISGPTAKAVAEKLVMLSQDLQVIVITHQPMVAAMADHHWHMAKSVRVNAGMEKVQVEAVPMQTEKDRLNVLSRMASGTETYDEAVVNFIQRLQEQARSWKLQSEKAGR